MRSPYRTDRAWEATALSPVPLVEARLYRPVDHAVAAIERGKLVRTLCGLSRAESPARTTGARGFMRHGHTPHVRRTI
jgi:hypothetical protein